MQKVSLLGRKFGKLLVFGEAPSEKGHSKWYCKCECGETTAIFSTNLLSGASLSCGCTINKPVASKSRESHDMRGSRTYGSWKAMKDRCLNPNDAAFINYGGRGITVDPAWKDSFLNFYRDMGERPEGCSLDRINVNGPYTKENCRWATDSVQAKNKRSFYASKLQKVLQKSFLKKEKL